MRKLITVCLLVSGSAATSASAQHRVQPDSVRLVSASSLGGDEIAVRGSRTGRGALIGGLVGAGVGGGFALAVGDGRSIDSPSWVAPAGFVAATALGALIGAAIGAGSPGEAAVRAPVPDQQPGAGDAVRVRYCPNQPGAACRRIRGSMVAVAGDSITVREASGVELTLPWSAGTDVRYAAGRRGNALLGAVGGALVGGSVGLAADGDCVEMCGITPLIGAGTGLLVGAAVGALIRSDRWADARPTRQPPVLSIIAPPAGAPGAGVRIAF